MNFPLTFTCSKSTIEHKNKMKSVQQCVKSGYWRRSAVFIVMLTLSRIHKLFCCFYGWLWTSTCRLVKGSGDKRIQNLVKRQKLNVLWKKFKVECVNRFRKTLHLRYLTGFWILLCCLSIIFENIHHINPFQAGVPFRPKPVLIKPVYSY